MSAANRFPGRLQLDRDTQFAGENIHRSQRQHSEPRALKSIGCVANAVENFIERPIAPGGHDLSADAALAASVFHFGELSIGAVKQELVALGLEVRQ